MIQRRKVLARGTPPRRGRKRIKAKGGSLFPKRRDARYTRWCLEQLRRGEICDGCGLHMANCRAHLDPKSTGGYDLNNIAFLCSGPGSDFCHERSEKRVDAFIAETGVDLRAKAKAHTARYLAERTPKGER